MSWSEKTLGDICDFQGGSQPPKKEFKYEKLDGYVRFLQIRDFGSDKNITYIPASKKNRYCNEDDILIGRYGASVGKILRGLSGAYNVALMKIIPDDEKIYKPWLYYFLRSSLFQKPLLKVANRSAQNGFNKDEIKQFRVYLPSLPEQKKIVFKLDNIFVEIDKLVKNSNLKFENSKKIFYQYLSCIFDGQNSDWKKNSLKRISLKIGSGATPKGGKESYKKEGISLIRSMNVRDLFLKEKDLAKIDEEQAQKLSNVEVKVDDVLLNITGASVARCCLVNNNLLPARVNQHVSIIRLKDKTVIPKFLMFGLVSKSYKEELLKVGESNGATRQAITKKQIEEFKFRYPADLEIQARIIDKLEKIYTLSLEIEQIYKNQINLYNDLKSRIVSRELLGESI